MTVRWISDAGMAVTTTSMPRAVQPFLMIVAVFTLSGWSTVVRVKESVSLVAGVLLFVSAAEARLRNPSVGSIFQFNESSRSPAAARLYGTGAVEVPLRPGSTG